MLYESWQEPAEKIQLGDGRSKDIMCDLFEDIRKDWKLIFHVNAGSTLHAKSLGMSLFLNAKWVGNVLCVGDAWS